MESFDRTEAARRIGVEPAVVDQLVGDGILTPGPDGRFTTRHLRRAGVALSLHAAGVPLDGLAGAIRSGHVSLDFLDAPAFERFSSLSGSTFGEVAERTGVPLDWLLFIREATGSVAATPGDRMRDDELPYAEVMQDAVMAGFSRASTMQMIRVHGDSLRRLAETESAVWTAEVIAPALAAGKRPDEVLGQELGDRMSATLERAVLSMYHLQQARAWSADLIVGLEMSLAAAGLHTRVEHPPAMCFLDLSGYTRLTEEQGDIAAASVAETLGRIVDRRAAASGGKAVKWLGDGVMLHFPHPGPGVLAALDLLDDVTASGLPPAHVGLHAGPVIFQEGDYYGRTVNIAARIAAKAGAGTVLVTQEVIDTCGDAPVAFQPIGEVELKGLASTLALFEASRTG